MGHLRLTIGYLKATVVHIRVTLGHHRVTLGHLRVFMFSISKHKANTTELHSKVRPTYILGKVRLGWDDQGLGSSLDLKTCCIFM